MSRTQGGRFCGAVFAWGLMVGLAQTATAETVSSGPVQAVNPSGQAAPARAATPDQIAPKETMTPAQLLAARSAPYAPRPGVTAGPMAPPSLQINFFGSSQTQTLRPPDTHGAVGLSQFVEVTNSKLEVFNKLTGQSQRSLTLNSFCGYTTQTIFDPRVVYDKIWKRWVVFAEAFKESSTVQIVCLAVSLTSDANGPFFIYRFHAPRGAATNFYDYPMLGMDQDAIIVTANIFNSDDVYQFSNMFAVAKADLYNGRGFSVPVFSSGASGTLSPPIVETKDSFPLFLSSGASGTHLALWRGNDLGRSHASFSGPFNVDVVDFSAPPDASQFGTTDRLDVLTRFVDHSSQVSHHVINVQTVSLGGLPTPRWWQINGLSLTQVTAGAFFESGTSHDFNPSLAGSPIGGTAANPIGRMFFTWTSTQPSGTGAHNARVKGSGRLATDSTTLVNASNLYTSPTFYNPSGSTVERWGDYSSVTLDPTAATGCPFGNRAYVVNERNGSQTTWGSRIGRLGFC